MKGLCFNFDAKNLEYINISCCLRLTDDVLEKFSLQASNLKALIYENWTHEKNYIQWIYNLKNLEYLEFSPNYDEDFDFKKLEKLKHIFMQPAANLGTTKRIDSLKYCKDLLVLNIYGCVLSEADMVAISECKNLKYLKFFNCHLPNITDVIKKMDLMVSILCFMLI